MIPIIDKDEKLLVSFGLIPDYPDIMTLLRDLIFPDDLQWPKTKVPDLCSSFISDGACTDSYCQQIHCRKLNLNDEKFGNLTRNSININPVQSWRDKCKLRMVGLDTTSSNAIKLYLNLEARKNDPTPGYERISHKKPKFVQTRKLDTKSGATSRQALEVAPDLCVEHLQGLCKEDSTMCFNVHVEDGNLFMWQYRYTDVSWHKWENFPQHENEALEAKYCMPEIEPNIGILDGTTFKVVFKFKKMTAKIYTGIKEFKDVIIRRVEAPGLRWNYFYQFARNGQPWRMMRKFNNSGIDSEKVDEMFEKLPANKIKEHNFETRNMDKGSKLTLFLLKTSLPFNYLIFQYNEEGKRLDIIKRRPHWTKPSLQKYLTDVYHKMPKNYRSLPGKNW